MDNNTYRTIWISDLHLGSTQCQADVLLDFLKHNESEKLYLVGDIIDFWALSKKMYWPRDHNTVIQKVLRKARHGTQVIYVPGNHDENVREYDNYVFGDIIVKNLDVHTSCDGKRFLVVHGDEYDTIAKCHKWIAKLGSEGYDFLLWVNRILRIFRRWFGMQSNFSLAAFVKFKVKNVVQFISDYEESIEIMKRALSARLKTKAWMVLYAGIYTMRKLRTLTDFYISIRGISWKVVPQ